MSTKLSPLNKRAEVLLKCLIEEYIKDGNPVGSVTLAKSAGIAVSPATIRNIMADLETQGFVASPHTSSGRIPTQLGYRFFVDSLIKINQIENEFGNAITEALENNQPSEILLHAAGELISKFTHCAGVVTMPKTTQNILKHIEFIALDENKILVVLVVNQKEVQNRIIEVTRKYSAAELHRLSNYINHHFQGKELKTIQSILLKNLENEREQLNEMMKFAMLVATEAFKPLEKQDYFLHGTNHLLSMAEEQGAAKLRKLFNAFLEKQEILHLLSQTVAAERIRVYIGNEAGLDALDECSVISAPYRVEGQIVGVLGVIGPTRMRYDLAIAIVELTANMLGSALNSSF